MKNDCITVLRCIVLAGVPRDFLQVRQTCFEQPGVI